METGKIIMVATSTLILSIALYLNFKKPVKSV